jgi:sodium-dependent dicarboxylate transporter 2/3/5
MIIQVKGFRNYLHIIIAAALFILIKFCLPAVNGLTPMGVNVLAVFIPTLYLWLTVGTDWVSMLALGALIMVGMYTPTQTYALSFGHAIVPTVIICMALTGILTVTGVTNKIAVWFITREFVRNKPYAFIAMFYLACMILGMFMETLTTTIIFITLAEAICQDLGYKKGDQFYSALMVGILWFTSVTTTCTPISHVLPLMLMGVAETTIGIQISFGQWMSLGVPYAILMYFLSLLIVRFIWKPEAELFKNYNIEETKARQKPLGIEGKLSTAVFLIVVFIWLFPQFGSGLAPGLSAFLSKCGATVPPIIAVALLCVLSINGKPLAKFSELIAGIPMGVIIFVAAVTVLGSAVSSEDTGISLFMRNSLAPITSGMPLIVIVGFTLAGAMILTNFISNTVTMLLFFSVASSLLADSAVPMIGLVILIGVLSGFGVMVPSAGVTCPVFFGPEHITVTGVLKYSVIMILGGIVLTMLLLWPLASILF